MPLWAEVFHTSEHRAYSLPLADMQTIDTIDEYNSRRRHARSTTFKFTLGQQEAPVSNPQRREAPPCNNWEDWSRRGCWQRQEHSEDFYQIPLPQAKEITSHPLFLPPPPPQGGAAPHPQESACAETSASSSPWAPLPLPWPCCRTARAHEWCIWAIKIFPPSAFPQEPQPKAACCHLSVAGINYLRRAGSGTFLPSLALQDVDIRQVGPASPGWQYGGDKGGGENMTHMLSWDRQKTQKNGKRSGKEHVGAAPRRLRAYRVPNARLDADGSLETVVK